MRVYEVAYILDSSLEEEQLTQTQEKFSEMVTKNGGEIVNLENWGKRRLAYEVNGKTEGVYVIMRFNSDQKTAENLRRDFNLSDDIIKSLLLQLN